MQLQDQLTHLINEEIDCLQRLLGILHMEQQALSSDDISVIERTTTAKTEALSEQQSLIEMRSKLVTDASFSDTPEGLYQLVESCDNAEVLETHLTTISTLSSECYYKNRSNGRLISQRQQVTRGALDVLRQADNNTATYSGHGTAANADHSRTLGKA